MADFSFIEFPVHRAGTKTFASRELGFIYHDFVWDEFDGGVSKTQVKSDLYKLLWEVVNDSRDS